MTEWAICQPGMFASMKSLVRLWAAWLLVLEACGGTEVHQSMPCAWAGRLLLPQAGGHHHCLSGWFLPHQPHSVVKMQWCWGRSLRRCDPQLTCELDPSSRRLLTPPLSLELAFYSPSLLPEVATRAPHWDSELVLRPFEWYLWVSPTRPPYTLERFWWVGAGSYLSCGCPRQGS